mmetsp:Transcript_80097/g.222995  ORF Transcript_80097/g.222995 Transcript_80097/m.222995 type:complete len:230 (-) Transcript_80097:530-1219(-)
MGVSGSPAFFTTLSLSTPVPATISAPSRSSPSMLAFPSRTSDDLLEMRTLPCTLAFICSRETANEGLRITRAPMSAEIPRNDTVSGASTSTSVPASFKSIAFDAYMSASADNAQSGGRFLAASARLFFTHVKHIKRSSCVKPILSCGPHSRGKSCIMHSSRVADLNLFLSASAHFGFTNSGTMPPVVSRERTISGTLNTNILMLPGYGEKPVSSGMSPPSSVDFKRGPS